MKAFSVRVDDDLYFRASNKAEETGVSLADLLRTAVHTYCTQEPVKTDGVSDELLAQLHTKDTHIAQLTDELKETRRGAEEASKRHDTIILQMTQQLDRAHLQVEDLRQRRAWWRWWQR